MQLPKNCRLAGKNSMGNKYHILQTTYDFCPSIFLFPPLTTSNLQLEGKSVSDDAVCVSQHASKNKVDNDGK